MILNNFWMMPAAWRLSVFVTIIFLSDNLFLICFVDLYSMCWICLVLFLIYVVIIFCVMCVTSVHFSSCISSCWWLMAYSASTSKFYKFLLTFCVKLVFGMLYSVFLSLNTILIRLMIRRWTVRLLFCSLVINSGFVKVYFPLLMFVTRKSEYP